MGRFCPKCGKENVDFYKGFCIDCYEKMHTFVEWPEIVEVDECKKCGRWKYQKKWIEDSFQNLQKIIKSHIKNALYYSKTEVEVDVEGTTARVKVKGFIDENQQLEIERENEVELKIKPKTCDDCMKLSGKYYEYKIQLRRKDTFDPMKFKRIEKLIEQETYRLSYELPTAKMFWKTVKKEGTDFFFGDKKIGEIIMKHILKKYKLRPERSSTLAGLTKAGKKKYKLTFCIRV